jgi:hypothetical protein
MLRGLAWDVGVPLLTYYGLHQLGISERTALLAATGAAAVRMVWVALYHRVLNLFATVMLVVFGLGVVLAVLSGDARFLLLKNSIVTAAVGLAFLATTWLGRPLTLAASQSFHPVRSTELAERYRADPGIRRRYTVSSAVWGTGLLVEAAVRVPLVYLLPISVMVGVSETMMVATFAALISWTLWYIRRTRKPRPFSTIVTRE